MIRYTAMHVFRKGKMNEDEKSHAKKSIHA